MNFLKKCFLMAGAFFWFWSGFGMGATQPEIFPSGLTEGVSNTFVLPGAVFLYGLYDSVEKDKNLFVQIVNKYAHGEGELVREYIKLLEQNNEHLQKRLNDYSYKSLFFDKRIPGYGTLFIGTLFASILFRGLADQIPGSSIYPDDLLSSFEEAKSSGRLAGRGDGYWFNAYDELIHIFNEEKVIAPYSWYRFFADASLVGYGMFAFPFLSKYNYIKMSRGIIFDLMKRGEEMMSALRGDINNENSKV